MPLDNPQIVTLKEAVNHTNKGNIVTVLHEEDDEERQLILHTKYRMYLRKEFPEIPALLKALFQNFFDVKEEVRGRFAAFNDAKQQIEQKKERVKIKGFCSENE